MVALTTFAGVREPSDLVTASFTPASSSTARTPPPAMSPVPGAAGLISTREALKRASTGGGVVVPTIGAVGMCLRATVEAWRIASGPSLAFPIAAPTCPAPSPTTTTAVKWKRRPPFITLATRLMKTTFSESSISEESTFARLPMYLPGFDMITSSELAPTPAGGPLPPQLGRLGLLRRNRRRPLHRVRQPHVQRELRRLPRRPGNVDMAQA